MMSTQRAQPLLSPATVGRCAVVLAAAVVVAALTKGVYAQQPDQVTFNRDIAPIIFANCSGCHRPDQAAPFSLLSYNDVKKRSKQIVQVTQSRYMPPWLPQPNEHAAALMNERRLSDRDIKLIEQWVAQGAIEGDAKDLPSNPQFTDGWKFGEPDLVLTLNEAYTVPAATNDTIRTFVMPVSLPLAQLVKAIDVQPGNLRALHHASFLVDTTGGARMLDAADPQPGYPSMGDIGLNLAGSFGVWSPAPANAAEAKLPAGIGRPLPKQCDLVMEVHFNPTGKPEVVQPKVGLYFAHESMQYRVVSVALGVFFLDIPADEARYVVRDSFQLPVNAKLLSVSPHAHYIARHMMVTATLPDGCIVNLLTIDDWDFNWQEEYRYQQPIELPAGTVVHMEFTYDNSAENPRNPNNPPKRVRSGSTAADEMALLFLTLIASDEQERPMLEQARHEKLLEGLQDAKRKRGF